MLHDAPLMEGSQPLFVTASCVVRQTPWPDLIEALRAAFQTETVVPVRHHHAFDAVDSDLENTLLLMPAWRSGGALGVKLVSVVPSNSERGLPAIHSVYVLSDATTGAVRAIMDGGEITARRTAGTSALAVDYLARKDASRLLIVGTGRLCRNVAQSHAMVRPLSDIMIWGRSADNAALAARDISAATGIEARVVIDLEEAVRDADITTCVTLSHDPLIKGAWLQPGSHLDLIGGFTSVMREADDDAIRVADVYVDTLAGAPKEAGDIVQPLASGILELSDIKGDLFDLTRGRVQGRVSDQAITYFKSAGHAVEDLAIAELVARHNGC